MTKTTRTPRSLVCLHLILRCPLAPNANPPSAPKKKTKRTKPKDEDDDEEEEEEEDDVSDDDDAAAAAPEPDVESHDEDANPETKKPAGAEPDRKVKTTGKAEPVPVVDDDDEE